MYSEANQARNSVDNEYALTIHGQASKLQLLGWQTCFALSTSHKVSQTCLPKRQ